MNRSRRGGAKNFVSGGVLNAGATSTPTKPQPQAQQNKEQQHHVEEPKQQVQQQQQKQVQQQQPQQQQQVQPQVQQQQAVQAAASADPAPVENMAVEGSQFDENGKMQFKKIFLSRKKSSVRAKEKKIRQNRQLRKAILPKNALMALNEVKGVTVSDFIVNANVGGGFTAIVTVNNTPYEGKGHSKMAAKNNACEKSLRDYVIAKMRQNPRKTAGSSPAASGEAMDTTEGGGNESEIESDGGESQKLTDEVDDVPMVNLASFAIYKLFSEWENEGYVIPEMHPSANGSNGNENGPPPAKEAKKAPIRTELPPNYETMHPATLLCLMRPGLTYTEYGASGEKPNVVQTVGVVIDDQQFTGVGRSKKLARRNAALDACNRLFGTAFIKEEIIPIVDTPAPA